jgi:DNA-binding CsgD family transcriptional regulator
MTPELTAAIRKLYDSVVAPDTWEIALHNFARATGSVGCLFYPQGQATALPRLPVSPDLREYINAYVAQGWYQQDPYSNRGWPLAAAGKTVLTDEDIVSSAERARSPYFQDYVNKWAFTDWAAIAFVADGHRWAMPLLRAKRQGPVDGEWVRRLTEVAPHLGHVIQLAAAFGDRQAKAHIGLLEEMGRPAALLDCRCRVIALTRQAEALLGEDLSIARGQFFARERGNAERLRAMLASVADDQPPGQNRNLVAIERRDARPLIIQAIGLSGLLLDAFNPGRILLLFFDPDDRRPLAQNILQDAFGLTRAEAKLAFELSKNCSLAEATDRLSISKETARTHLKAIFAKTGKRNQGELAAMLARLPRDRAAVER